MTGIQLREGQSGALLRGTANGQVPVWNQTTQRWEVGSVADEQLFFDVDIRNFGAVAGGDIVQPLRDAYAALPATGGRIIVPSAAWTMTDEFEINTENVHLVAGHGAKITKVGADHHIFKLGGNASFCTISGFNIDGNLQPQGSLILCEGSNNLIFDNYGYNNGLMADGPYTNQSHGICLDGQTTLCVDNLVFGNHIVNCHDIGISQNTAPDNEIASNRIYANGLEGITIDVTSHRSRVHFNRLQGNCIRGGVGGIGIDGSDLWEVIGNQIIATAAGISGIKTQNNTGPSNFGIIQGNLILDNGGWGVWFFAGAGGNASNHAVLGNVIRGNPTGSMRLDAGCDNNAVVGNSINGVAISDAGAGNSLANNV